jgi:hypothetical protein
MRQQRDVRAFFGEYLRDRLADAAAAAGDQRSLARQLEVHACSLSVNARRT